ncbi:MAG: putative bifunctional diguanylate cyclase/phosphodiesterase [Steroidobacteraceae bacterium]
MIRPIRARIIGALPTIVVLAVVLIAGSRLIYLSVYRHAALARERAAAVSTDFVRKIEPPLQRLSDVAARQAASATRFLSSRDSLTALETLTPAANMFWMTADDNVLSARSAEAATAGGIASEWQSAESSRAIPGSSVLGPLRLGSQWLITVRFPVFSNAPGQAARLRGWSVAYADLDELIADTHLARLVDMGYDFELSQIEPRSARTRIFVGSSAEPLTDAVSTRIALPAAAATAGSYLELAIQPRAGWYPASLLASDIALLAFLAWLLAFGTHDLSHALQRARASLVATRRRVRSINEQMAAEMQQRLNLQQSYDHARFHDTFTGLPNRRYFMDQLDRTLRDVRAKRRQRIAVIIIDIARFKLINDTLGHTAGDELMVQVARRFEESASAFEGTLARWSGDQFALLILDVASAEAALDAASLIQDQLRSPFQLRRHQLIIAAHLGVTIVDSGQQRAEDIVREADIALSIAKRQDTTKIVVYAQDMGGQAANLVSLEADLYVALEKHQLYLLFQPIVDLRTYKMVGAEALLRWRHPVEGVVDPDRFLRIAEEAGLMVPITRWIIFKVVTLAGVWLRHLPADQRFYISINLSPTALRDPGLSEYLATLLRETQLPPSALRFELTELALTGDVGAAREALNRLQGLGCQLMLDDFGTGYSSLSNLQLFPFDCVKIDCPFVILKGSDQANTRMIAAMIQIVRSLNLTAIAEIVDTEAAAAALQRMGCNFGQGYYFSEPIEAELALHRLRSQEPFHPPPPANQAVETAPLAQDRAPPPTIPKIPDAAQPAPAETSETMEIPILVVEDSSQTIIMPLELINFSIDGEEEEEDEE